MVNHDQFEEGGSAVLYIRQSSPCQDGQSSIDGQKEAMMKFAQDHGIEIVGVYTDEGRSGKDEDGNALPALTGLLTAAQSPEVLFDKVLVYARSRLTRSPHEALVFMSLLRKHGVRVVSVTEPADPSAMQSFIVGIFEAADAFLRERHSEDTRRGIAAARRRRQCS